MRIASLAATFAAVLVLGACGQTTEQQAATGALGGAAVAGVPGAVVGGAAGAIGGDAIN